MKTSAWLFYLQTGCFQAVSRLFPGCVHICMVLWNFTSILHNFWSEILHPALIWSKTSAWLWWQWREHVISIFIVCCLSSCSLLFWFVWWDQQRPQWVQRRTLKAQVFYWPLGTRYTVIVFLTYTRIHSTVARVPGETDGDLKPWVRLRGRGFSWLSCPGDSTGTETQSWR